VVPDKERMCPGRGTTTAEKLRGTKVWVPPPGRLRPAMSQHRGAFWVPTPGRLRPAMSQHCGWGGVQEGTPGKFLKTQMLKPAF